MKKFITCEAVTCGHPDKICDRIADSILDEYLKKDKKSRVACEVTVTTDLVNVFGEITSNANIDIEKIVRKIIKEIGYDRKDEGFSYNTCKLNQYIDKQSEDISDGIDKDFLGAGDQGIMYGFACDETLEYMPLCYSISQRLAKKLEYVRKNGIIDYLRPDGKTQVTMEYENDFPKRIDSIVISSQHDDKIDLGKLRQDIYEKVIIEVLDKSLIDNDTKIYINPAGRFVIGGPHADSGLTGRKIMVDTYGTIARHGGGAFSGKDPSKVDRSGAYIARYIAKNIVASSIAKKCEVSLSYVIGRKNPASIGVNTFGTSKYSDEVIIKGIEKVFDLTPSGIINKLELDKPIYKDLSTYGHFGRDEFDLKFEKIDKIDELLKTISKIID